MVGAGNKPFAAREHFMLGLIFGMLGVFPLRPLRS
jgi:hypothetical protein